MQASIPNAYSDSIHERVYGAPLGRYYGYGLPNVRIDDFDCRNRRLTRL